MSTPAAPGWYEDPDDPSLLRYFDGIVWTAHTTPRVTPPAPARPPESPSQVPTGWSQPPSGTTQQYPGYGQQPSQPNPWAAPPVPGAGTAWQTRRDVLPDGDVLAEWWRRLLGKVIDWVIVGIVGAIFSFGFLQNLVEAVDAYLQEAVRAAESGTTPDTTALQTVIDDAVLPITLITLAVTVVYDVAFLVWRGATPGKMALGTVVRPAAQAGPVDVVTALRRQVLLVVANLIGLVPIVGLLGSMLSIIDPAWLLWDARRQALHDKVADTVVVLRRR